MAGTILIGGTSHAGKSTLAAALARAIGGSVIATDSLGRHPGRPWPEVRSHVAEFYQQLSPEAIYQFLLHHHDNLWPGIQKLIESQTSTVAGSPLIIEGSAIRPELVAQLADAPSQAVWLVASNQFLEQRMYAESRYNEATKTQQRLIEQFVIRSLTDNSRITSAAHDLGSQTLDVESPAELHDFIERCKKELL